MKLRNQLLKSLVNAKFLYLAIAFLAGFFPLIFLIAGQDKSNVEPAPFAGEDPKARRIISTNLATDEILWELLQLNNLSHELVGVSYLADDVNMSNLAGVIPPSILRVGQDPEALTTLKPTHIILASYNNSNLLSLAQALGVKTLVLSQFDSLADIKANIFSIARFLNLEMKTAQHITANFDSLNTFIHSQVDELKPPSRALLINPDLSTTGSGTIVNEILEVAGFENYAAVKGLSGWVKVSPEFLLKADPDYLFLHKTWENPQARPQWLNPLFQRKKIIYYRERELFSASQFVLSALFHLGNRDNNSNIENILQKKNSLPINLKLLDSRLTGAIHD